MKIDFIIVGQGLAGTLLAFELLKRRQSFIIIDQPAIAHASSVAAGIINPVVFRRMTKSWMVDETFPVMEAAYHELEELLNTSVYSKCSILKILDKNSSIYWKEKVKSNQLEEYLETEPDLDYRHPHIHAPFGVSIVKKAGRLDIQKLITHFRNYLEEQGLFRTEPFDFDSLIIKPHEVQYEGVTARKIIFCEGASISFNPFFSSLKFKHSKGELLEVRIPDLMMDKIINGEVFLMPIGNHHYKVGATYRWDNLNEEITTEARQELLSKLETLVHAPVEVISQQAGIRPITHDRKPVMGFHPAYPIIGLLNGLGSKGALLGPWLAGLMADNLVDRISKFPIEIEVKRYFK